MLDGSHLIPARYPNVSRETLDRLEVYAEMLLKWGKKINLISRNTTDQIWERHILDSIQLLDHLPMGVRRIVDIGSGAGLPIVPMAIAQPDKDLDITLIESDARKCEFLRAVLRATGSKANVISSRIEDVPPQDADILTARALAPLSQLFAFADRHLLPAGRAIFLKGAQVEAEIEEAQAKWTFSVARVPSITSPEARILLIEGIERV